MQNQPQRKGGGDDGLMIIGALLIMITVMWLGSDAQWNENSR